MKKDVQALVLILLGVVVLRISWTDQFLNYVKEPMRPLLLGSGLFLFGLGVWSLFTSSKKVAASGASHGHDHSRVPAVAWLMVVPIAAIFLVAPPPLGADAADRDSGVAPLANQEDTLFDPLPDTTGPVPIDLSQYAARALYDDGRSLEGRTIELEGFVSNRKAGDWYLTRFVSSCCAADASAIKVWVKDSQAPPLEQWVRVTGRYTPAGPEGNDPTKPAAFELESIEEIPPPRDTYL